MYQIMPMEDEESGAELRIINTSFADPYILVLRDDCSVAILQADEIGDIEELESGGLSKTQWLSGCLFKSPTFGERTLVFLLTVEGGLRVCPHPPFSFLSANIQPP